MIALRRLYNWVLHWAETPYGPAALFVLAFAESSFFPIPPDVLLIALALGSRERSFRFAANCTLASILGAILGYGIGHYAWWGPGGEFTALSTFFFSHIPGFSEELFYSVQTKFEAWNFWVIFTAGFTPIPYKVFTISAGAFDISFPMFMVASIIARAARFFIIGSLIWKFGESIRNFIDTYFNWLAILFTVLLIGGFLLIRTLI